MYTRTLYTLIIMLNRSHIIADIRLKSVQHFSHLRGCPSCHPLWDRSRVPETWLLSLILVCFANALTLMVAWSFKTSYFELQLKKLRFWNPNFLSKLIRKFACAPLKQRVWRLNWTARNLGPNLNVLKFLSGPSNDDTSSIFEVHFRPSP